MEHKIANLKEKELLIARQLLIKKPDPTDENIISAWCELFPADKPKLNDTELFEWMRKFIKSNNICSCNEQLERVRRKGESYLKSKCAAVGYGAKLVKQPNNKLATYDIFTKGRKYSGNHNSLCKRIGRLSKLK